MESESEDSEIESDAVTFKAFIIRYLYYLREQSIINQVQKIKSVEEVRKIFRLKASESDLLQFHQIEALSSSGHPSTAKWSSG